MVKKIYTVILQSAIAGNASTVGENFFYDWTQIPDVPYILSFSFMSASTGLAATTQIASLYADINQSYCQIASAQNGTVVGYKGSFLGSLFFWGSGANSYMYAEPGSNTPLYLNGRPRNNNFLVQVLLTPTTDYTPAPGNYNLVLSFQEC